MQGSVQSQGGATKEVEGDGYDLLQSTYQGGPPRSTAAEKWDLGCKLERNEMGRALVLLLVRIVP